MTLQVCVAALLLVLLSIERYLLNASYRKLSIEND